jgi:putative DNA-invertase from lambdoid prophage Rac
MIHCYVRVSTSEQGGDDKTSLKEQEKLCRAAALLRGESEPRIWRDEGVSGSIPLIKRPEGHLMLAAVAPGELIVAAKLDRLFRSASDALVTAEQLHAANVDIILLDYGTEPIMSSLCGRLFFQMLAAFAEFERGRIRERIMDGKRAKQARGGSIGGKTPYGYRLAGKDHLEPVEAEMWLIHRARILQASGYSWKRIADHINEAGYRTRNGTPFQARQIGRWLQRPAVPEEATAKAPLPTTPNQSLAEQL